MISLSGTTPLFVSSGVTTSTAMASSSMVTSSSATGPTVTFMSLMSAVKATVSRQVESVVAHALGEPACVVCPLSGSADPHNSPFLHYLLCQANRYVIHCICMYVELLSSPPLCPSWGSSVTPAPTHSKIVPIFSCWISAPFFHCFPHIFWARFRPHQTCHSYYHSFAQVSLIPHSPLLFTHARARILPMLEPMLPLCLHCLPAYSCPHQIHQAAHPPPSPPPRH